MKSRAPISEGKSSAEEDASIIKSVLSGDKDDYRHLVTKHQDRVFSMIYRLVGNESDTRDLAQDVFLKAYLNLAKFQFRSSFETWLTRIAINTTHNYFASRRFKESKKTINCTAEGFESLVTHSEQPGFSDEALLQFLQGAIQSLKPKHREVITLCALEQKSYEEAARILEIPIGTARSRLHSARLKVREHIKGLIGEDE